LGRGEGDKKNGGRKKEKKEDKYRVSTDVSDREGGISFRRGRARGIWFWTDIFTPDVYKKITNLFDR
jgi:hypothetical protein